MFAIRRPIYSVLVHHNHYCKIVQHSLPRRLKSTSSKLAPTSESSSHDVDTNVKPLGEKVKETTETTSYFAVILLGLGICGGLMYTVFSELFSSKSPNNIYSKAVTKCIENSQVSDKLGYPISAYGEETRRGRRQHVSHALYTDKEGKKHIRMKFHLKGTAHTGTAHLDMVENDYGNYEYRFLFIEVDDLFKSVIVVEDNRNKLNSQPSSLTTPELDLKF